MSKIGQNTFRNLAYNRNRIQINGVKYKFLDNGVVTIR